MLIPPIPLSLIWSWRWRSKPRGKPARVSARAIKAVRERILLSPYFVRLTKHLRIRTGARNKQRCSPTVVFLAEYDCSLILRQAEIIGRYCSFVRFNLENLEIPQISLYLSQKSFPWLLRYIKYTPCHFRMQNYKALKSSLHVREITNSSRYNYISRTMHVTSPDDSFLNSTFSFFTKKTKEESRLGRINLQGIQFAFINFAEDHNFRNIPFLVRWKPVYLPVFRY